MIKDKLFLRVGVIFGFACFILLGLVLSLSNDVLDELKFNLSLWTIIALVFIINIVSFLCFLVMYLAYQWIKHDMNLDEDNQYFEDVSQDK